MAVYWLPSLTLGICRRSTSSRTRGEQPLRGLLFGILSDLDLSVFHFLMCLSAASERRLVSPTVRHLV